MLTIPIKQKWFRMVQTGEKTEEYRENNKYWRARICHAMGVRSLTDKACGNEYVLLRNGYRADSPTLRVRVGARLGQGRPEWGAEPGRQYIVLDIREVRDERACNGDTCPIPGVD